MDTEAALANWTDDELVTATRQGNHQAFGELVCRHRLGVVNVVYRMSGDPALAEEASQEAFVKAWQHLEQYKPQFSFRSWLYRIAINAALDRLRGEPAEISLEDFDLPDHAKLPEAEVELQDRARAVQAAILALRPASRNVLVLREYEGLSYLEIAQALRIPLGTVMSRLNSARSQLRRSLAGYLEEQ